MAVITSADLTKDSSDQQFVYVIEAMPLLEFRHLRKIYMIAKIGHNGVIQRLVTKDKTDLIQSIKIVEFTRQRRLRVLKVIATLSWGLFTSIYKDVLPIGAPQEVFIERLDAIIRSTSAGYNAE